MSIQSGVIKNTNTHQPKAKLQERKKKSFKRNKRIEINRATRKREREREREREGERESNHLFFGGAKLGLNEREMCKGSNSKFIEKNMGRTKVKKRSGMVGGRVGD